MAPLCSARGTIPSKPGKAFDSVEIDLRNALEGVENKPLKACQWRGNMRHSLLK
jgi:hypothetical protein